MYSKCIISLLPGRRTTFEKLLLPKLHRLSAYYLRIPSIYKFANTLTRLWVNMRIYVMFDRLLQTNRSNHQTDFFILHFSNKFDLEPMDLIFDVMSAKICWIELLMYLLQKWVGNIFIHVLYGLLNLGEGANIFAEQHLAWNCVLVTIARRVWNWGPGKNCECVLK